MPKLIMFTSEYRFILVTIISEDMFSVNKYLWLNNPYQSVPIAIILLLFL